MSDDIPQYLKNYRAQIDALDVELIELLAKRFQIVRNVGQMKADLGMEVVQAERAQAVIDMAEKRAAQKGVPPALMRTFYEMMIDEAHVIEHEIAAQKKDRL